MHPKSVLYQVREKGEAACLSLCGSLCSWWVSYLPGRCSRRTSSLFPIPCPYRTEEWRFFSCPSTDAQMTVLNILGHNGFIPDLRADTPCTRRAIFWNKLRMIINIPSAESAERFGNPGAGLAIVVSDPVAAARTARHLLTQVGFEAEVIENPDADLPPGTMAFVRSNAFTHWILIFRKHITKMGKRPPRWREIV